MEPTIQRLPRLGLVAAAALVLAGCAADAGSAEHGGGHDDDHAAAHAGAHDDRHAEDTAPIDGADEVAVTATSMAFAPDRLEVTVGEPVNIVLTSEDIVHDLTVEEVDFHLAADGGETTTGGLVFDEPGDYTGYCTVPGHREAGMELEITVS